VLAALSIGAGRLPKYEQADPWSPSAAIRSGSPSGTYRRAGQTFV